MDSATLLVVILVAAVVIPAVLIWLWQRGRKTPQAADSVAPVSFASVAPAPSAVSGAKSVGKLQVTAIHHGTDGGEGEWVMLVSDDFGPIQLEGWKLTDEGARHAYTFPAVTIAPSGRLRVHMWDGVDDGDDLYVGRRQHWWNNDGDTAYLYDAHGTLVHSHHYGPSPVEA